MCHQTQVLYTVIVDPTHCTRTCHDNNYVYFVHCSNKYIDL